MANHPFVDANERTALNTTVVFYFLNGYRFAYDDEIRTILKRFGTDQTTVDEAEAVGYLRSHTEEIDLVGEIEQWRDDLIQYGLDELTGDSSNRSRDDTPNMATEEGSESSSPLDEVMDDIRRELVQRVGSG